MSDEFTTEMPTQEDTTVQETGPSYASPVIRFLAKLVDILLASQLVGLAAYLAGLDQLLDKLPGIIVTFFIFLNLFLYDTLFLSLFSTTPGKAFFSLSVRKKDMSRISFPLTLGRSLYVWIIGLGFGIPIISLLTALFNFFHAHKHGVTSYDTSTKSFVIQKELKKVHYIMYLLTFLILVALLILFVMNSMDRASG